MKTVLPYDVLTGDVLTKIVKVELDGKPLAATHINHDTQFVDLRDADQQNWTTMTVHVQVLGPISDLSDSASPWNDVKAVVTAESRMTDLRAAVELGPDTTQRQRWSGNLDLAHSEVFGTIRIEGGLTATVDGVADRRIGSDEGWQISLDDVPAPPTGDALSMTWEDFNAPTDPAGLAVLKQNATLPCLLLTTATPVLYLNSGFAGLTGLLASGRKSAAESALQDAVRTFMAAQTWTLLFVDCIQHVTVDEDDNIEWPSEAWRVSVLRMLVGKMHGVADDNALRKTRDEFQLSDTTASVMQQVHVAAAEASKTSRLLTNAISGITETE